MNITTEQFVAASTTADDADVARLIDALCSVRTATKPNPLWSAVQTAVRQIIPLESSELIARVTHAAAAAWKVFPEEIQGRGRSVSVAAARQLAMVLFRELAGLSYERTGAAFGRDHGTVLYACRRVTELARIDREVLTRSNMARRALGLAPWGAQ